MSKLYIGGVLWDDGNINHALRRATMAEIEQVYTTRQRFSDLIKEDEPEITWHTDRLTEGVE